MEARDIIQVGGPVLGSVENSSSGERDMAEGGDTGGSALRVGYPLGGEILTCKSDHAMVRGSSCTVCDGQWQTSSQLETSSSQRVGTGGYDPDFSVGDSSGFGGNPSGISRNPLGVSGFLGHSILGFLP